jgi:hypothetical protein
VCCKKGTRIHVGRNPCAQHHPACPNHARTACSCSHELRPTYCLLGRHLDDTWSSPPSPSRCRGHRLFQASETKVKMSRSAARYARSWPRPRRPSPWHALCTRQPLSSPGMGHGSLAPLTSHGTRLLPCAQVRVDRVRVHVPAAIPVFRLQPAPPRPARGYRSKNGEDPSSWAQERSRVRHWDSTGESMWWVQLGGCSTALRLGRTTRWWQYESCPR